jgi:hypothetical protein
VCCLGALLPGCGGGGGGGGGGAAPVNTLGVGVSGGAILSTASLDLEFGSALGSGASEGLGAEVKSDGTHLFAINSVAAVGSPSNLGPGPGSVIRLSGDGQSVLAGARLPDAILDFELRHGGTESIAVVGLSFRGVLAADLQSFVWSLGAGGDRVSIAGDGRAAVLANKVISVYDSSGALTWTTTLSDSSVDDIAIDSSNDVVVVTGFRQVAGNLRLPLLRAFTASSGAALWTAYGYGASEAQGEGLTANSEGLRVAIGQDGLLAFAGRCDGGNTVFQRSTMVITQSVGNSLPNNFQSPVSLSGSASFAYLARLNLSTGQFMSGSFLLPRTTAGGQDALSVLGIDANGLGEVAVTGACRFSIRDGSSLMVSGLRPAAAGSYLAIFDSTWSQRCWVGLALSDLGSGFGVGLSNTRIAVSVAQAPADMILTDPLQAAASGAWVGALDIR